MTTIDTNKFRDMLLAERERVQNALDNIHEENAGSIEDETGDETQDQHLGDTATAMFDREMDYTLEDNSEHVLAEINAALARIDDGSYGTCTKCGRPISQERLEARPWASLCIDDARQLSR